MSCSCDIARPTGLPRTESTTSLTFLGAMRMLRAWAKTSMVVLRPALLLDPGRSLGRLAAGVAAEVARRCELAELVADHVLGDVNRHVAPTVVHGDGVRDHLREDR